MRGGFAMAVGAAFYERLVYDEDGGCVTGSLLDYALPTASSSLQSKIQMMTKPSERRPSSIAR